jgi:hypothetical protein
MDRREWLRGLDDLVLRPRYELADYGLEWPRGYTSSTEQWAPTLFANNLTDEVYANYEPSAAVSGPPLVFSRRSRHRNAGFGMTRRPSEYGLTFQYNFGWRRP